MVDGLHHERNTRPIASGSYGKLDNMLSPDEVAFVICVEANRLEPQGRLVCESIRTYGGRYRDAPIIAVSPRPRLAVSPESQAYLVGLGVTCVVESLNNTGSPYGSINRIVTGAWAEESLPQRYLVVLDTDTVLVDEPNLVHTDVGVRPVDVKGSASTGIGDPLDVYWLRLCSLAGIEPSLLPVLKTSIDNVEIRASYNGGFAVVRRDLGILQRTKEIFFASLAENLRPLAGSQLDINASTGLVGREASEWWGSSQAALSIAIWSKTSDVHIYDSRYNIPMHILVDPLCSWPTDLGFKPVLIHYHYLAEPQYRKQFREVMRRVGCSPGVLNWIEERTARFESCA